MFYKSKSSVTHDVGSVIHGLAVDLQSIIETHRIPSIVSDVAYNDLIELSEVGFRVNNDFDLLTLARRVSSNFTSGNTPTGSTGASQVNNNNVSQS